MSNFKIGQKVVCVSPNAPTKDIVHIAEIVNCPECNTAHIGVQEWAGFGFNNMWCDVCRKNTGIKTHHRGCAETFFRPLLYTFSKAKSDADEILEIMETLQEAVK